MILGTFNGANIIALPAKPGFKDLKITQGNTVAVSTNPWTKQQQVYDWMAGWWEVEVTLPPLTEAQARAWFGFFSELRGQTNVFLIGDPVCAKPTGTPRGAPLVNGSGQTGYSLDTRGWTANAPNVLNPGDYIQIGYRLYLNTETVSANSSGDATLSVWPQLRSEDATFLDGEAITTHNCVGLFRLKDNSQSWSTTEAKSYGFQFSAMEAL